LQKINILFLQSILFLHLGNTEIFPWKTNRLMQKHLEKHHTAILPSTSKLLSFKLILAFTPPPPLTYINILSFFLSHLVVFGGVKFTFAYVIQHSWNSKAATFFRDITCNALKTPKGLRIQAFYVPKIPKTAKQNDVKIYNPHRQHTLTFKVTQR